MLRSLLLTLALSAAALADTTLQYVPVEVQFPAAPRQVLMSATSDYGPMTDERYELDHKGCHMEVRGMRIFPGQDTATLLQEASSRVLQGAQLLESRQLAKGVQLRFKLTDGQVGQARIRVIGDQLVTVRSVARDAEAAQLGEEFVASYRETGLAEDKDEQ
jgi:hypothetical protein